MKTTPTKVKSFLLIFTATLFLFSCDQAKERDAKIDSKISKNLITLADISDLAYNESQTSDLRNETIQTSSTKKMNPESKSSTQKMQTQAKKTNSSLEKIKSKINNPELLQMINDSLETNSLKIRFTTNALQLLKIDSQSNQVQLLVQLKIEKSGVLDRALTDYNEKKSILTLANRPIEQSTHLLIGDILINDDQSSFEEI